VGTGSLVLLPQVRIKNRLRVLRNQGMRQRYVYEMAGNNFRMTDLQAAVCIPQLHGYSEQVADSHGFPVLQKPYEMDTLASALGTVLKREIAVN